MVHPDPEVQKAMDQRLSDHAQALGFLCVFWSQLELTIDIVLSFILHLSDEKIRASILHNIDLRAKIQMLISAGFVTKPTDEWFIELREIANHIDNDLRPERNRMVHDQWSVKPEAMLRKTNLAKVVYEQARQLAFKTGDEKPVSVEEISALSIKVRDAGTRLMTLIYPRFAETVEQILSGYKSD